MVGRDGRVYAVDSDPLARDEVAARRRGPQPGASPLTQAGEDLSLPEQVDLAFCRFLLLHVLEPLAVVRHDGRRRPAAGAGWWPRSPSPRPGASAASPFSMPDARHPDIGALLPALVRDAGLERRRRLGRGAGRRRPGTGGRATSRSLTGVDPGDDPVVLPPLVTVIGRRS